MESDEAVTCQIRYTLDLNQLDAFEAYARAWIVLIERHGGLHHGYFIPRPSPDVVGVSFPGLGFEGPTVLPWRCSPSQTRKPTAATARGLQMIQSARLWPPSFGRLVALPATSGYSFNL